ncbi:transposase [Candidatus Nitrospira bockiana]
MTSQLDCLLCWHYGAAVTTGVYGGLYHVTARGNERKVIVRDNLDRARFVDTLAMMVDQYRVRCHAWVLMDNHYHLLLEPPARHWRTRLTDLVEVKVLTPFMFRAATALKRLDPLHFTVSSPHLLSLKA